MLYHRFTRRAFSAALLSSAALTLPHVAQAQDTAAETEADAPDPNRDDDFHGIVVTAAGLDRLDILAGTDIVAGTELQRQMDGQVGEILVDLPGVSATGFAPGASRPVLRGFSGERVKVLVDGIGAIDVSNTSADHAVSIDPLTADRIEVLRGPAVLLYGSQAIGGAVNIIDKRIPVRLPAEPIHFDAFAATASANELFSAGASIDVPLSGEIVFHLDGSWRSTGDVEVPGFVASDFLRADLLADAAEEEAEGEFEEADELREAANVSDVLPNSGTETWSVGTGLAWIGERGNFGASFGVYDTFYGVPLAPGAGHHHGEEDGAEEEEEEGEETVSIGLRQYRADVRGSYELGGAFSELRLRGGYSDYTHTEFEGDEVGTVFDVTGFEGRVELVQRPQDDWRGSSGFQYYTRDFAAEGAEAYVAPNTTDQFAVFTLQETMLGNLGIEGALRYERTDVASAPLGVERGFNAVSGALGVSNDPIAPLRYGVNLTRVSRAPSAEELFSNGPHIATQQFEIGDVDLGLEQAWGVEAYAAGRIGDVQLSLAGYSQWFDDFIYLAATGGEEDDLPIFEYRQQGANWYGLEGEIVAPLGQVGAFDITGELGGEYVRAELADGSPVPRLPPFSTFAALEATTGPWTGRVSATYVAKPAELAEFETPTDAFTLLDASLTWKPLTGSRNLAIILQGENLLDQDARRHASFTKDFVPLPGRNVKLSVRLSL